MPTTPVDYRQAFIAASALPPLHHSITPLLHHSNAPLLRRSTDEQELVPTGPPVSLSRNENSSPVNRKDRRA
jgi:hypothetical protein